MWSPWRKPAAVFLSEKRLLVEGIGDTFEDVTTEQPVEELFRLLDRANGYRTSIFLGAGLVRLTAVPRVAKLRRRAEREKAASALAQLPLSEWHLTVIDPSADSTWLVHAMKRQVFESLAELRSKHEARVHSIKPYSGVVFESLLAHCAGVGMFGLYESNSDQLSWLVASDKNVSSAGQVSGITRDLLPSETTRLSLANGVSAAEVRIVSFECQAARRTELPARENRKSIAFNQLLSPVSTT